MDRKFCWYWNGKIIEAKLSNRIIDYALLFRDNKEEILLLGELPEVKSLQQLEDIFSSTTTKAIK